MAKASLSNAGRLRALLEDACHVVVFSGAGISTESGIPDFRSPGGLWTKFKPIQFKDFLASAEARREYWRRRFATLDPMEQAQPNRGHRAVARLVDQGKVTMVVTQNIDGLHQRSGVSDEQVVELHGNATYARCLDCSLRHEIMPIRAAFLEDGDLPICESCGGIVKSATISFGQAMPQDAMARAEKATLASDLFLAIGSSLVVYPAAAFPVVAKRNGARLIILNRDSTDLDGHADLVLHDEIGPVLGSATGVN